MHQRKPRQLVGLHQREGRARHLDRLVVGEIADQRAGERGLAGAEIARQRDQVAGLERGGDVDRQPLVACSSGSATVKLDPPEVVSGIAMALNSRLRAAAATQMRPVGSGW